MKTFSQRLDALFKQSRNSESTGLRKNFVPTTVNIGNIYRVLGVASILAFSYVSIKSQDYKPTPAHNSVDEMKMIADTASVRFDRAVRNYVQLVIFVPEASSEAMQTLKDRAHESLTLSENIIKDVSGVDYNAVSRHKEHLNAFLNNLDSLQKSVEPAFEMNTFWDELNQIFINQKEIRKSFQQVIAENSQSAAAKP